MTILALMLVQLLFGALPIATKIATAHATPIDLMVIRTCCAWMFFDLLFRLQSFRGNKKNALATAPKPELAYGLRRHTTLFMLAVCGASLNQYLLFLGVMSGGALVASIVVPSIPLFTVIVAILSRQERFHPGKLAVALCGLIGVLVLLLPPSLFAGKLRGAIGTTDSGPFILGIVFCALSALLSAIFLVFSKPVAATMGPIRMLRPLYGYGFLISIAIMLIGNPNSLAANTDTLGNLASDFWMATAFIVLGSTITANMLNMYAIRRVAASTVGGFVFLQTIVGVSLSVGYLGEALEARHVVATGFIVVGLAGLTRIAWREARIQHGVPEKSGTQCDTIN